ncbi:hypothetical protein AAZX31_03G065000 [Glycine max]|uniref:Uncharacterized protein n=2 Tax=Glycine subgen. Soja TaxID=1462606 RepID=K7KDK2_SOYBN|nr:transcription factor MYB115-like [Glycine soja]KAG4393407.1 hypothetical protein GLYMA_03G073764v4 [Glycine max]KAG5042616.1 hypothetical protein JHK87_006531 [Glycine soja]KAG5054369.1 hypothetical protein JHK85_006879 [Glycine max]KAG5071471.1 hypothetical protein JHK86_006682 [Glycine max]KAH1132076.1 hypothetical protein GYH30_057270 [Glycine max]|eukprot:XP_006576584.1 transcription factor MYB115 [Glycine max]
MDFGSSFQRPQYLSSLFPRNSCLMPQTQAMFPSQNSIHVPLSPPLPAMFHPNNTFHHFQDPIMNGPTHNPPFAMNGPFNPITTPMYGIPTPALGDGSSLSGFVNVHHHHPVTLAPNNNKMEGLVSHNPSFIMNGPSNSITTPMYGIPTPSLGDGSSLGGFVNIHHHHHVTLDPNNNKMEALYGHHKGKHILDFSQNAMMHPYEASSSKSPLPFSLSNVYEWGISEYHQDIDWKVKMTNDSNIANDKIIKGQWTSEEDSALLELVNQFGPKKWSQIAKLLHGRIGKQCRERWYNHLQPNIKKGPWSVEEDQILIEAHKIYGNKWTKIGERLPGRTENTIKNRWNGTKRRQNFKKHNKNNQTPYEGSMLHAYIKKVTATK